MALFDKEKLVKIKGRKEPAKKHTIMIVDDEETALRSLESLLVEEYQVITAKDGQEALNTINTIEHPGDISVIMADQLMPHLTGIQLFEGV